MIIETLVIVGLVVMVIHYRGLFHTYKRVARVHIRAVRRFGLEHPRFQARFQAILVQELKRLNHEEQTKKLDK